MATMNNTKPKRKTGRVLSIRFEKQSMEIQMDEELAQFIQQIEPNTAKEEDVHVFHGYFQLYWPFKTEYTQVNGKTSATNKPQLYRGYRIFQSY